MATVEQVRFVIYNSQDKRFLKEVILPPRPNDKCKWVNNLIEATAWPDELFAWMVADIWNVTIPGIATPVGVIAEVDLETGKTVRIVRYARQDEIPSMDGWTEVAPVKQNKTLLN